MLHWIDVSDALLLLFEKFVGASRKSGVVSGFRWSPRKIIDSEEPQKIITVQRTDGPTAILFFLSYLFTRMDGDYRYVRDWPRKRPRRFGLSGVVTSIIRAPLAYPVNYIHCALIHRCTGYRILIWTMLRDPSIVANLASKKVRRW